MKTIREWFETFPEPYRTQAMENADDIEFGADDSAIDALLAGFAWSETPEGYEYWNAFYNTLN